MLEIRDGYTSLLVLAYDPRYNPQLPDPIPNSCGREARGYTPACDRLADSSSNSCYSHCSNLLLLLLLICLLYLPVRVRVQEQRRLLLLPLRPRLLLLLTTFTVQYQQL